MDNVNATILKASSFGELPKYTKVFNLKYAEETLWVNLRPSDVRDADFLGSEEVSVESSEEPTEEPFIREGECWLKCRFDALNTSIGKHIIRLLFWNKVYKNEFSLYVAFYIQNDSPVKPYIYANKDKDEPEDEPGDEFEDESEADESIEDQTTP